MASMVAQYKPQCELLVREKYRSVCESNECITHFNDTHALLKRIADQICDLQQRAIAV